MEASHLNQVINQSKIKALPSPADLAAANKLTDRAAQMIVDYRKQILDIMKGEDNRMIAVVGPCAEDDSVQEDGTPSVVRFANELSTFSQDPLIKENLLVVMRCNPAKPRSELGLAGLEQKDPMSAHRLLTDISNIGIPLAIEVMSPEHLARYGSLLSMVWIGARNNQDTRIRHALSAYSQLPALCKNSENGDLKPALQALTTIKGSHQNAAIIMPDASTASVDQTTGNQNVGLVWRGGGIYASFEGFEKGLAETAAAGYPYAVDCAHGNEIAHSPDKQKSVAGQLACFDHLMDIVEQSKISPAPTAVLIEAYLLEGNDPSQKTPGKSWVDPCINLDSAKQMLTRMAKVHAKDEGIDHEQASNTNRY